MIKLTSMNWHRLLPNHTSMRVVNIIVVELRNKKKKSVVKYFLPCSSLSSNNITFKKANIESPPSKGGKRDFLSCFSGKCKDENKKENPCSGVKEKGFIPLAFLPMVFRVWTLFVKEWLTEKWYFKGFFLHKSSFLLWARRLVWRTTISHASLFPSSLSYPLKGQYRVLEVSLWMTKKHVFMDASVWNNGSLLLTKTLPVHIN